MLFGKHINRYYLRYSWVLLLGILALVAVDVAQLLIPELYAAVVDGLDPTTPATLTAELLVEISMELLIIAAVMIAGRFLWRVCFFGAACRVESKIRDKMFDKCRTLSQEFYQENKVGGLMSLFTNDLETVNECFGDGALMLFDALALGTLSIVKMARLDGMLTLYSMIPLVFMGAVALIVGQYMQKKWEARQAAFSDLSDFAQETFSGIAVIKAFVRETHELSVFRKKNKNNEAVNVSYTRASVLLNVFITLFVQSVICVILGYGGWLVYSDPNFKVSQLIEFISYFTTVIWPIMAVSNLIEMTSRGRASLGRISKLLDEEPKVRDREDALSLSEVQGEVEFRNLSFRYPDGEFDVLHDVSFTVKAGEHVGIIGKTGAGKTTLLDLLLRTYTVSDGTLFLDGHDINALTLRTVRKNVAYVPQDNFLFSDTIGANIAFAMGGEAPADAIEAASTLAALHDNVSAFPEGYGTVLGERGVTISGGQKQRTSIARALLKDAAVLILDDAVSAVDTGTESLILDNLAKTRHGKTTVMIAHRVSTVERMDRVVYLEEGRVVAIGTHEELIASCPDYANLVQLQRLEDEIGGKNS